MNTKRRKLEKMLWAGVNKTWAVKGLRMHTRYQQCSAPAAGASRASRLSKAQCLPGCVLEKLPKLVACKYKVVGAVGQSFCSDFNKARCWRVSKEASRCSKGLHRCAKVLASGKVCCASKHGAVNCKATR